jgi:proteasome assembly chaperone (PAC2) family protein
VSGPVRSWRKPAIKEGRLVVGWTLDAGRLGGEVTANLIDELHAEPFAEIEPVDFFALGGVAIINDIAQFPESRFYACPEKELIIFRSTPPDHGWFRFFNLILDVARDLCNVKEVYTVGSMVAFGPHTAPRQHFGTVNSPKLKKELSPYGVTRDIDFETPPGGKPTLNSFFLWTAKRRRIRGANLWVPVPFYLVGVPDPASHLTMLQLLDRRLELGLDTADVAAAAAAQDDRIARIRADDAAIDGTINKLEGNERLDDGEGEKLAKSIQRRLRPGQD